MVRRVDFEGEEVREVQGGDGFGIFVFADACVDGGEGVLGGQVDGGVVPDAGGSPLVGEGGREGGEEGRREGEGMGKWSVEETVEDSHADSCYHLFFVYRLSY